MSRLLGAAAACLAVAGVFPASGMASDSGSSTQRTPVVLFPAFHFTKLLVTVHDQVAAPGCPRSGTFQDWFLNDHPSARFSQVCEDKLLTLRYDGGEDTPWARRFSNPRGVTVRILHYGTTESAPFYEPMYEALEAKGYTPDMNGFMQRTKRLIQTTYRQNGHTPVQLVGHSNGPLYAQYLLTHTSAAWKHRYIHGFTPIAGNLPGQGFLYPLLFTGLNIADFSFPATAANARSSARMYLMAPSSYMSAADPAVFGAHETVVRDASTGRSYTPRDYRRLFRDAGLGWVNPIANHYIGFVKFADPRHFPQVDVHAEKGSGIATVVGAVLPNLHVGQVLDPATAHFFTRDGDVNQEDITNGAVRAWRNMRCFRFQLTDNPGVDHFSLPSDPGVLARLVATLARPRSHC